ncbi:sulfurtransferase [Bizionia arctica]|uniref:Sulfurtransferase n=1 Tax=Bizionia arctica TaxID=1495645 RepID=A0A917LNR1_9FLAO|nr:rhodanese-like domain-containing protein [Bizionia arctica]GGG46261.1 sulfurtransferase [Bizionia arctica]
MINELKLPTPIVSVGWLHDHLNHPNLVVLNATIPKVTENRSNTKESQIPSTRFFDLKNKFSDVSAPFPTTFPSVTQFEKEVQTLGINKNSVLVVYDDKGIFSSPRVWWLFKAFGFNNVAVLDGGFPAWKHAGFRTEEKQVFNGDNGDFQAKLQPKYMKFFEDVKKESIDRKHLIIDARSENRFNSLEVEPREGLRSGTIPNSVNLPFENLLDNQGLLKPISEIKRMFQPLAETNQAITFSCGSGITACVLALGAELAGYNNLSVYDGSWTEWGSLTAG